MAKYFFVGYVHSFATPSLSMIKMCCKMTSLLAEKEAKIFGGGSQSKPCPYPRERMTKPTEENADRIHGNDQKSVELQ